MEFRDGIWRKGSGSTSAFWISNYGLPINIDIVAEISTIGNAKEGFTPEEVKEDSEEDCDSNRAVTVGPPAVLVDHKLAKPTHRLPLCLWSAILEQWDTVHKVTHNLTAEEGRVNAMVIGKAPGRDFMGRQQGLHVLRVNGVCMCSTPTIEDLAKEAEVWQACSAT